MNRQDVCILIHSTPKYFYLLPLHLTLLRRYAPELQWPVYFATEEPNHPIAKELEEKFQVKILELPKIQSGFLESRFFSLQKLPNTISYVLPLFDDFFLERKPDFKAIKDALFVLDTDRNVSSLRLMPYPGPNEKDVLYAKEKQWKILTNTQYLFTYQATLWRKLDLSLYYHELLIQAEKLHSKMTDEIRRELALMNNIGESRFGQEILQKVLPDVLHLSWPQTGSWMNAVYLSPWPYRPTGVRRGNLEPFAKELFEREGVKLDGQTTMMM